MDAAVGVSLLRSELPAKEVDNEGDRTGREEVADAAAPARASAGSFADSVKDMLGLSRRPFLLRNLSNFSDRLDYFNLLWIPRNTSDQRRSVVHVNVHKLVVNGKHMTLLTGGGTPRVGITANVSLQLVFEDVSGRKTAFTTASQKCEIQYPWQSESRNRFRDSLNSGELSLDMTAILTFLRRFPTKATIALIVSYRLDDEEDDNARLCPGTLLSSRTTLYDSIGGSSPWIKKGTRSASLVFDGVSAVRRPAATLGLVAGSKEDSALPLEAHDVADLDDVSAGQSSVAVGTAVFDLHGGPEWTGVSKLSISNRARDVHVSMSYTSNELPWWNGIDRHDFVCPWCHLTTRRLRSLLMHLQVDHRSPKFTMDGPPNENMFHDQAMASRLEIQLNIQFMNILDAQNIDKGAEHANNPRIYRCQHRHPTDLDPEIDAAGSSIMATSLPVLSNITPARPSSANEILVTGELSSASIANQQDSEVVVCSYCKREYLLPLTGASQSKCCGEWCFLLQEAARTIAGQPAEECPPLISFASPNRGQTIDFRNALGNRELYHVISVAPFPESHFDENDPDSEDEVDHSWRLTVQEEDITTLPVGVKHKLLWTMWNRHVFENDSCGSYGYQFTRYEVEIFAIELRPEILRLGLRVHFVAFLRALSIHGHIDSEAVLSAVQCLDHRKKRRACKDSRRARKSFAIKKF
jgi:VEFS-Box of polycomb protein